jgi:hypothetical protein
MEEERGEEEQKTISDLEGEYSENFVLTKGVKPHQAHLFLVKFGLWSLVYTFTTSDFEKGNEKELISQSLKIIEDALTGRNPKLKARLDFAVSRAKDRVAKKRWSAERGGK